MPVGRRNVGILWRARRKVKARREQASNYFPPQCLRVEASDTSDTDINIGKGGPGKLKIVRGGNTIVVVVDGTVSNAIRLTVPPARGANSR